MNDLMFKALFTFNITFLGCKVGKEGIHKALMEIVNRQKNAYLTHRWSKWLNSENGLFCNYTGEPFGNLRFEELVNITDENISYKYEECTNQQIMLPNTQSYIYMMLFAVKTVEQLLGGFNEHSVRCEIKLENNADTYFYEKYNPLSVDYSFLLKYAIGRNVNFTIELENHEDVYILFNRFFNQYKAEGSIANSCITLVKDLFEQIYGAI